MSRWAKKRGIMRRYDLTAHLYDMRYAEEQKAKYEVALESVGNSDSTFVLDAGCGTGLMFDYTANRAKAIVGLDISRKTLLFAKEYAKAFSNVHLVCADVDYMPFGEKLFSHAYAMTLIQNSPNPLVALQEIIRVSKDNAIVVVTGLKKVFSKKRFEDLIRKSTLRLTALRDESDLKCYVAACAKTDHSKTL
jgi:malonyl-CoA O-methyltransferase